ncbi:hypothetical protein [Rhodosalinus sp.]|uniref:hypothetical protein n=1 Tax=Rhodosalinus sp. TaxID=2047741 RepID=UPI00397BD630
MREIVIHATGLGLIALAATTAATDAEGSQAPQCGPRAEVLAHLEGRFGESRRAMGLSGSEVLMELHASDETGSWTITATTAADLTCLVAAGGAFAARPAALPGAPG